MKRIWGLFFALVSLVFGVTAAHADLYFSHVAVDDSWQTEICLINLSPTDTVQGNLDSYNNNGVKVASTPLSLEPNTRKQIDVGSELVNADQTGYIVFSNSSGSPVGYTKFTLKGGDRVAIPAVDSATTDSLYVTHIAWGSWWTGISLVNTTTSSKTLTFRFNTGETRTITLGPKQHQAFMVASLFGNQMHADIESAVIENASGVVGLEIFGNGNQLGGVPIISTTASTLFFPHVASTGEWWTGIVAYNPSSSTIEITVNPYDDHGNLLGSSTHSLGPGQRFFGYASVLNLPSATAWFSLQSQNPLIGFELFGTHDGNRLAGFSVVDLDGKAGIFPKVEKNGWTGIAFVNTENQQATVTLKAYDDTGRVLETGTTILNAHAKRVGFVESMFSDVTLNAASYLSFSADRNVAGFQLNNASSDKMLDALPASSSSGQKVINKALNFMEYQSMVSSLQQGVSDIIGQIISGTGGTCPQVSVNPPLDDLSELPSAITITASYGSGCTASDGTTVSGQMVLAITNLTMGSTGLGLDYALTAASLAQNGVLLLNGTVSGHVAVNISGSVITLATMSVDFDNLQVADSAISGNLTLSATDISLSGGTFGNITISFDNLTAAGYSVYSGTVQVSGSGSDTIQMDADLDTSQGDVNLTLIAQSSSETRTIINTLTPGTIAGYSVTLTDVTIDTSLCDGYPVDGSVTVSQGGSSVTEVFTPDC